MEVLEPRIISKAPPEELVVSPDFIEAKDFVQTVKVGVREGVRVWRRGLGNSTHYSKPTGFPNAIEHSSKNQSLSLNLIDA